MTREERELQDVDRQMEEQLIQEHMQASAALWLLWLMLVMCCESV